MAASRKRSIPQRASRTRTQRRISLLRSPSSSTGISDHNFIDFRGWDSGTSFSAPYLAGKTALLIERYGDLTQEDVIQYWKDHVEDLDDEGYDKYTGFGLPILGDVNEEYVFPSKEENKGEDEMKKFKDNVI